MTRPLSFDRLYDLRLPPLLPSLEVSPDGERVAFVVDEFDREENERLSSVFVAPTDGSRDPHRLTRASTGSNPQWSPDGSRLAVLAAREEDLERRGGGDGAGEEGPESSEEGSTDEDASDEDSDQPHPGEGPRPQVWVYDLEYGGDARQVTAFEEGVSEFDWSPDGERLVVAARDPTDEQLAYLRQRREENGPIETERLQHKADGAGWLDDVTTYLHVVDIETGTTTRLDEAYGAGAREHFTGVQPVWSPDGDRIAFVSNRTERPDDSNVMDVYTIRPDGDGLTRITDGDVMTFDLSWGPAGEHLAFTAWNPDNFYDTSTLYVAAVETGTYRPLSASLDRPAVPGAGIRWLDEDTVVAAIGDEGLTRPAIFPLDETQPTRGFPTQGTDRELGGYDVAGETFVTLLSDPQAGVDVYAGPVDALYEERDLTRLTALNDDFVETEHTPRVERVTFENDAGDAVESIVYLPDGFDPDDPEPVGAMLSIHGGPMAYDAPSFDFEAAAWTSRGYLVIKPNYRGSISYGQEFCDPLRGRWGTVEVADQVASVETLIDRGWIDADRTFVTGFSYGGISTAHIVTQTDLFTAAAAEHGIYDLRSVFGTGDMQLWHSQEFGLPWEEEETYTEHSSITDVARIDTPLLITAGGQDWRTPPSQSEQLYVSVKKRGVPSKLVVYPNEHHNVHKPERRLHRIEELTSWFERFDPAVESDAEGTANGSSDDESETVTDQ